MTLSTFFQTVLPILLTPRYLIILIVVFSITVTLLSFLKVVSSLILKLLIAFLIVVIVASFLGIRLTAGA
ncbi:hypothetical protein HGA91_05040 [candidate division WWE3 bacterium]|nr:hypothetical protein [candidate division WWE3 bacterium]